MSRKRACAGALFVLVSWAWLSPLQPCWAQTPSLGSRAPVLMWQYGGCIPGPYCNTGWHSSPVVADLNGDGQQDVIWGSYDVVALNGADGSLKWRAPSGNRVWPGIAVADLTGNGTLEVIVGRDSDQLTVYDRFGGVVWTRNPFGGCDELRSLAVADLDKDGQREIITGQAAGVASRQLNVLEANGTVRPGWPARHDGEPGDSFGMWNQNVVVADMNSDGFKELFVPGGHYINAFDRNGNQLTVNPIFAPRQFWSEVGTHVDQAVDLRGYANCGVEHRPSFQDSAPVVADVDGDGVPELIVVGNVYNCGTTPYTSLYHMPFIFKLDRTRWSGSGFDWTVIPTPGPGSAPRSEDYNVIENVVPNAVVADLDGDGLKEILFPSYDGKVHAYWLDKTEHGSWPYTVPTSGAPGDDFRFASEPVVVDLDNDGHAEVIFTSWPKKATGGVGQLHVLDYLGRELYRVSLPASAIGASWNGSLGAPTIANIDSDPDLELVTATSASGVVAYKLPNTANARVLWGTGRGNYGRTGVSVTVTAPPPPDTTPPLVPTGLTASAVSSSQINLSWTASSDNVGVSGYRVYRGGTQIATTSTTSFANTGLSASTTYSYTVAAYDAAGNVSAQSSSASATTPAPPDTTAPTVSITSPVSGATVGSTTSVAASASDNVGVVGVQFLLDGANLGAEDTSAPYSVSWNTTTASNASHTLTAVARDAAGLRTTSAPVTVTVFNDTTAPTVSITSPVSGATVGGTTSVTASATRRAADLGVQFLLDGANLGAEDAAAPYSVSWNTTTASNGSHTLTAVARDAAGNRTTSAAVTVTVFNDTTPPTVSITSPVSGATVGGTTSVTANASDNVGVVGVQFLLDGANLGVEDAAAPYSVSWNTTTASNGSHTLTAVARDAAGNRTTSAPVTVTVFNDTTPPSVTINQAASQADPTNSSPINFTAVFSKPVSGFTGAGVAISGTAGGTKTVTVSGGPSTYTVAVSGMSSAGTVIASIAAGVAQDAAGNTNTASTSTDNSVSLRPPATP